MAHHTGERRYACEYCTRTFVLSGNYYKHRKRMHGDQLKYDLDLKQKQQNVCLNCLFVNVFCVLIALCI